MTNNNEKYINEARTILNNMIGYAGNNGYYPRTEDLKECGISIHNVNKYFGTINNSRDAADEYYNDMNYDLEYVCEHRITFMEEWNKTQADYNVTNPEVHQKAMKKMHSRRRGFGTPNPINKPFQNSHMHHLHLNNDHTTCIYIPNELHTSVWHAYNNPERMEVINQLAFEWLATQDVV